MRLPDHGRIIELAMRSMHSTLKAGVASAVSLWMAVLVCVTGCTQPVLASSPSRIDASPASGSLASGDDSALMADMGDCHHADRNSSVPPHDRKPAPGSAVSCCPLEVTLTHKPDTTAPKIVFTGDIVSSSDFHSVVTRFWRPGEFAQSTWPSGRDTLLQTHLLRI